jgi:hypothetical protein
MIYLIGTLVNPDIVPMSRRIQKALGEEVFSEWHHPGPEADLFWQKDEQLRGRSFIQALSSDHAWNVFNFDVRHMVAARAGILALPAGKSAYAEMGFMRGSGKDVFALLPEDPERWDLMLRYASDVVRTERELIDLLKKGQP